MKPKLAFLFLIAIYPIQHAAAKDEFRALESGFGDITVMHKRRIHDFSELQKVIAMEKNGLDIVVTTQEKSPSHAEYHAAKAYAESLKAVFPNVRFTIGNEGTLGSDYFFVVSAYDGYEKLDSEATVYGTRSTGMKCSATYDDAIQCKESSSALVPVGTKSVKVTDKYVDIDVVLSRSIFYGERNPKVSKDGTKTIWESARIADDSFTLAYEPGRCRNEASAVARTASFLAKNALASEPSKTSFQSNPKKLRCNEK